MLDSVLLKGIATYNVYCMHMLLADILKYYLDCQPGDKSPFKQVSSLCACVFYRWHVSVACLIHTKQCLTRFFTWAPSNYSTTCNYWTTCNYRTTWRLGANCATCALCLYWAVWHLGLTGHSKRLWVYWVL